MIGNMRETQVRKLKMGPQSRAEKTSKPFGH